MLGRCPPRAVEGPNVLGEASDKKAEGQFSVVWEVSESEYAVVMIGNKRGGGGG